METSPSSESSTPSAGSSTGLQTNVAGLLAYLLGWVTGLIFLLIEKKDETVRWHAAQSFVFSIALFVVCLVLTIGITILSFIPFIGGLVSLISVFVFPILGLVLFVVWIILMVKTFQGEKWELPLMGQFIPMALKIKT